MAEPEGRGYHYLEACQLLGISPATLRRMALFYEAAFVPLPTDARGGRIYPDYVLKQMQAAKDMVDTRRAGNLETAFKLLANGDADEVLMTTQEPAEGLLIELKGIRQLLERMSERMEALETENRRQGEEIQGLKEQLALPKPQERRKWWKWPWWW